MIILIGSVYHSQKWIYKPQTIILLSLHLCNQMLYRPQLSKIQNLNSTIIKVYKIKSFRYYVEQIQAIHLNFVHLVALNYVHLVTLNFVHLVALNYVHLVALNYVHLVDLNFVHIVDLNFVHLVALKYSEPPNVFFLLTIRRNILYRSTTLYCDIQLNRHQFYISYKQYKYLNILLNNQPHHQS